MDAVKEKPKTVVNGIKVNDLPKFPYEDLIKPTEELPEGVNAELKEVFLHKIIILILIYKIKS